MSELPVGLPPMRLERRGGPWREAFYFLVAFGAMFGGALLAMNALF